MMISNKCTCLHNAHLVLSNNELKPWRLLLCWKKGISFFVITIIIMIHFIFIPLWWCVWIRRVYQNEFDLAYSQLYHNTIPFDTTTTTTIWLTTLFFEMVVKWIKKTLFCISHDLILEPNYTFSGREANNSRDTLFIPSSYVVISVCGLHFNNPFQNSLCNIVKLLSFTKSHSVFRYWWLSCCVMVVRHDDIFRMRISKIFFLFENAIY